MTIQNITTVGDIHSKLRVLSLWWYDSKISTNMHENIFSLDFLKLKLKKPVSLLNIEDLF